ncbi:MAG: Rho termination protein [Eubacterium sp.]
MYKVIHFFTDLQDFNHPYNVGDIFPRDGLKVGKERLIELSGSNNKQGKPLIKLTEEINVDKKPTERVPRERKYTKTEINRMKTEELRKMAVDTGVEGADTMTGTELKEYFINVFGL